MNIDNQKLTTIAVIAIIILFAYAIYKMPGEQKDHEPIFKEHHNKIDSLLLSIDSRLQMLDRISLKVDSLSAVTAVSQTNYTTYKLSINDLLNKIPKHHNTSLDSLRSILTK